VKRRENRREEREERGEGSKEGEIDREGRKDSYYINIIIYYLSIYI